MKKIISVSVVIMLIAVGAVLRGKYVYIDGEFYERDIKEIFINMNDTRIHELNRCTELEFLAVSYIDNDTLEKMHVFENLSKMWIVFSKSEINGSGIEKLNMLPDLKDLYFYGSDFDLSSIRNNSLETIVLDSCNITDADLEGLTNCSSLNELKLISVTMDNSFIVTQDESFLHGKYTLIDSSCFSELDNITKLDISGTFIEDIAGIAEMDSLESLTVYKGYISEEYKKTLEDQGITVIEYVRESSET